MSAAHYKLDNLTVIVDNNGLQIDGSNDEVMSLGDMPAKLRAFGFDLHEIDGHDLDAIEAALGAPVTPGRPKAILAHTVKGKGVSFMENDILWHYRFPHDGWEYDGAVSELYAANPDGVEDPYTINGITNPVKPEPGADIGNDHTTSAGWRPTYIGKEV